MVHVIMPHLILTTAAMVPLDNHILRHPPQDSLIIDFCYFFPFSLHLILLYSTGLWPILIASAYADRLYSLMYPPTQATFETSYFWFYVDLFTTVINVSNYCTPVLFFEICKLLSLQ